jgi:dihydroorotase
VYVNRIWKTGSVYDREDRPSSMDWDFAPQRSKLEMTQFKTVCALGLAFILSACSPTETPVDSGGSSSPDAAYDIVVNGGRVLDPESQLDAIRSIGIKDGKIIQVAEEALTGTRIIEAAGLVVAPGFIDLHSHGQSLESDLYKAHDGVTTALDLELGRPNLAEWIDLRQASTILNFGASASHQYARTRAASSLFQRASLDEPIDADQIAEMGRILDAELAAGGIGIGVGIGYVPGASRQELIAVFQKAAEHSVPVFEHVRNPDLASIEETIDLARETQASLHIMHINSMALAEIEAALGLVAAAQESGLDVTTELYPYTAGSTFIETAIFDEGWQENFNVTYSDLQWQETGERLTEATFEAYRRQGGAVIIHMMREEWIELGLASDLTMIASDGMPYAPGAHPRSAGTFSRVLGRYVRERNILSLPEAVRKMTLMPARRLEAVVPAARRKGRIQSGMDADITIFDPATVLDQATFEEGLAFSAGIEFVIVNGTLIVDGGETVSDARAGNALVP